MPEESQCNYLCYLYFFDAGILSPDVKRPKLPDVVPAKISCSAPAASLGPHSGFDA